ncbi:uncharacterized protein LOC126902225 isoform X2 [Daktulosphaira vitifoliae]|uniref:uncharacterized protein LOC126902225 isoform X2 n=1 Tax=Daktulosphaira vitifoliae TaxID=58002 RepID=UPI0021AA666B|nr:uncharacterized protein LOC126902225 isoform X2 [Daktulosphaira vitifoliae]
MLKQSKFVNLLAFILLYFYTHMCDTTGIRNQRLQAAAYDILHTNRVFLSLAEDVRHFLLDIILEELDDNDYDIIELKLCPSNECDPLGYGNSLGNNEDVICPDTTEHYLRENWRRCFNEKTILWGFFPKYIDENWIKSCEPIRKIGEVVDYQFIVDIRRNLIKKAAIRLLFHEYAKDELCGKKNKKCTLAGVLNLLTTKNIFKQTGGCENNQCIFNAINMKGQKIGVYKFFDAKTSIISEKQTFCQKNDEEPILFQTFLFNNENIIV